MSKFILGIQSYANHDSGACILKFKKNKKTEIIAISEERILRKKYPYTFPIHSIMYCMKYFGIKNLNKIDLIVSDWIREKKWLRSGPSYNYQSFDYIKEKLNFDKKKIIQISHHLAHAASTYYTSSFNSSAILIVDGNGSDLETNSFFEGKGNKINFIENYKFYGIGTAYGAVTNNILNLGTGGEGKTMGLAPYGKYNNKIKIPYELNGIKTNFKKFMLRLPLSDVLNHINENFRPYPFRENIKASNKKNIMNRKYVDWAYMIQNVSEKVMINLGKELYDKTKNKNICLAGGVALNSVANEKLFQKNKFKDIFIFPACSDTGIPYGLVLWAYHNKFKKKIRIKFKNAFTGITYNLSSTLKLLKENKIFYQETSFFEVAKLISEGKIIGNFFGGSEYGPRALGNRSILADPRKKHIRDYINKNIKHREIFRPFAPSILEEKSFDYFKIKKSPYMLRVTNCRKKTIPSALHVDNTARVQTVNSSDNPNFYKIIKEFYKLTGVPVLLNTSFNDAGEPLVESPLDAIITALKTNIDYLVLEKYLVPVNSLTKITKEKLLIKLEKKRNQIIKRNEIDALKILTKNYSKKELRKKIILNNKIAVKDCLNKPHDKIKNYLKKLNQKDNLIIIGSNDHTNILIKLFKLELKKIKNIMYYEINVNDVYKHYKKIKIFNPIKSFKSNVNYNFLISSYEHSNDLIELIKKKKIKSNIFMPYDNGSRSIIDYYYIKKFKGKNKIYSKKLF
jgi:carbamoyltransferase